VVSLQPSQWKNFRSLLWWQVISHVILPRPQAPRYLSKLLIGESIRLFPTDVIIWITAWVKQIALPSVALQHSIHWGPKEERIHSLPNAWTGDTLSLGPTPPASLSLLLTEAKSWDSSASITMCANSFLNIYVFLWGTLIQSLSPFSVYVHPTKYPPVQYFKISSIYWKVISMYSMFSPGI
jgi:hypothetical protein